MPRAAVVAIRPPRLAKIEGLGALGFRFGAPGFAGALPDMLAAEVWLLSKLEDDTSRAVLGPFLRVEVLSSPVVIEDGGRSRV